MILPNTQFSLLDFADESKVSQSVIYNFIKEGGSDYIINAWVSYACKELKNRVLLDGMTPVGGLELGRQLFEQIFLDFEDQFEDKNPE